MGRIPVSLSNASNLLQLDLAINKLIGSLPLSFGNLRALIFLNIPSKQLRSDDLNFLTPLMNCSRLKHLDISNNKFTGEFPRSIGNLSSKLSWLNFYNNSIHGSIPAELEKLVGLNTVGTGLNFLTKYGMGAAAPRWGDVYSYAIVLLDLFTGNSPVDETFQDGLNLHNFVKCSCNIPYGYVKMRHELISMDSED
ncbi:putative receptor-like protein kinase At3g47110 [Lycium ferocissimum]|uniref:putative receptor-like protein kinase At3g47110 n=1 Tax=Lycium ferocissimum TaxID=112874 RepID=UPI00281531DB|nr:putative receptor-like protein kinase At3g47110 [Lycium ferocissimum]